ncbi:MAG: ABC transporter substrate-binding protein [Hyphomicrobiaceae bacterium]
MTLKLEMWSRRNLLCGLATASLALSGAFAPASAEEPIKIGLAAALSGQSAKSGEAIVRGLTIAIDEINDAGGIKGRKIELVARDDESNPGKGLLAARELVQREKVAALFGGLDTPVSLAIVPFANQSKVPFLGVWAAGTNITRNGAEDNYVFRVSAVDAYVGEALVDYAVNKKSTKTPGLILINNPWGESNEHALLDALKKRNMKAAGVEKFENNDVDVVPQLTRLKQAGADTLFLVANAAPSSQVVKSLVRMGWDVPIVSHWGPSGGRFTELAGPRSEQVDFIQTFTFTNNDSPKAAALFDKLKEKFGVKTLAEVMPATGVANAYDAMHLLAIALANSDADNGTSVRDALYNIGSYDGLIKTYNAPFSKKNHDALTAADYIFTHFVNGEILPVAK